MAKQIYIDANGNEIEISGTINNAEILPVAAGSETSTATAIAGKTSRVGNADDCFVGGATNNLTSYTFQFKNPGTSTNYKHFIMFGGTYSNEAFMYIGFCLDGTGEKSVTLTPILAGNRTFTATYNQSNGQLTINANSSVYGGIKVIWVN